MGGTKLTPLYRRRNRGTEKQSHLHVVLQQVRSDAKIQTKLFLTPDLVSSCVQLNLLLLIVSVVLGFEFRALHLLGKCSTTQATSPVLFALGIFLIRSCIDA
jgi:hypothetical protein